MARDPQIGVQRADDVIARFMIRADRLITLNDPAGRAAARELMMMLTNADTDLRRRLRRERRRRGGGDVRFTEVSLQAYRTQVEQVLEFVQKRLEGLTNREALRAMNTSLGRASRLFSDLERAFTGSVVPVRIEEAARLRLQPSLLNRHATSVDRYGDAMIARTNRILSDGFVRGRSQSQMVDELVRMRGPKGVVSLRAVEVQPGMVVRIAEEDIPEGLFMRYRSWAWRIVRTEVAEAQNAAHLESITRGRDEFPDMKKKILATFDTRTAMDSVGVHGQVRPVDGLFMDGAGRTYQRPPSRPHDREVVIPWRDRWPETRRSAPPTEARMRELGQLNDEEIDRLRPVATSERRGQTQARRAAQVVSRPAAVPRSMRAAPRST